MKEHVNPDQLSSLIDGEIEDDDRRAIERHLDACRDCRIEFEALSEVAATIGSLPRTATPEHDLWAGISRRLDNDRDLAGKKSVRGRYWLDIAAGFLLVALVGTAILMFPDRRADDQARVRQLIDESDVWSQLEGVQLAGKLDRPGDDIVEALFHTLETNESNQVRLAAMAALRRHSGHPMVQAKLDEAILDQASAVVQVEILGDILTLRPPGAAAILEAKLGDDSLEGPVRRAIEVAIGELQ